MKKFFYMHLLLGSRAAPRFTKWGGQNNFATEASETFFYFVPPHFSQSGVDKSIITVLQSVVNNNRHCKSTGIIRPIIYFIMKSCSKHKQRFNLNALILSKHAELQKIYKMKPNHYKYCK